MQVSIKTDFRQARRQLKQLADKDIAQAARVAINETATSARNLAVREIREERNIKAAALKRLVRLVKANMRTLTAWLYAPDDQPIPLKDYSPRATKTQGAKVRIFRKGALKPVSGPPRRAFIVKSLGGHVFMRTGKGGRRGKSYLERIRKVFGPSLSSAFIKQRVLKPIHTHIKTNLPAKFKQKLDWKIRQRRLS